MNNALDIYKKLADEAKSDPRWGLVVQRLNANQKSAFGSNKVDVSDLIPSGRISNGSGTLTRKVPRLFQQRP